MPMSGAICNRSDQGGTWLSCFRNIFPGFARYRKEWDTGAA